MNSNDSIQQYEIHLPDELTSDDKNSLFQNYIGSVEAHINLLEIIMNIRNSKRIKISDKTRLLAKQRIDVESKKIFERGVSLYTDYYVYFDSEQEEELNVTYEERKRVYSYSKKWLEEHRDYETLLNNFIYLFNYADTQKRINLVSKKSEIGIFESVAFIRSKDDYPSGGFFNDKLNTALLHLEAYYYELERMGILYEEIIEWFFEDFVEREFNLKEFTFKMPSKESTFLERARSLFPEIEAAIKQYKIYVEEFEVNHELLEISSGSIRIENIPSLVNNKYIYGNGPTFKNFQFILASNQSKLSHIQKSDTT